VQARRRFKIPFKEKHVSKNKTTESPLDDVTYDLITVIHEKAKGLEAFDQYLEDAAQEDELVELLEAIRAQDEQAIEDLRTHLVRLLQETSGQSSRARTSSEFIDDDDSEEVMPDTSKSGGAGTGTGRRRKAS
jgi:hypothetical protein